MLAGYGLASQSGSFVFGRTLRGYRPGVGAQYQALATRHGWQGNHCVHDVAHPGSSRTTCAEFRDHRWRRDRVQPDHGRNSSIRRHPGRSLLQTCGERDSRGTGMDRLASIVRCQWRAYWRRFSRARNLTVGHQGITLIITVLIFFKYLRLLGSANIQIAQGDTTLVQSLLAAIFLAWLFLPTSITRTDVSFSGLRHLPLSVSDLFGIRIVSLFIKPYSWMTVAGSLAICYPLAHAPRPWLALSAALLFIPMSCSTGLAMAHLLTITFWRRILFAILVLLSAAAVYVRSGQD